MPVGRRFAEVKNMIPKEQLRIGGAAKDERAVAGAILRTLDERQSLDGLPVMPEMLPHWGKTFRAKMASLPGITRKRKLRVGDWVEVRSKEEILRTLDCNGRLDGMPFMPEMFRYCGGKFRVFKRAHKTCDYVTPYPYRTRRLDGTVHLETRCDGEAHSGCQAGCLLYWKEAWLKPATADSKSAASLTVRLTSKNAIRETETGCAEAVVWNRTHVTGPDGALKYTCQATEVPFATAPLPWWDLRQYFEDYWSGNVDVRRLLRALGYSAYYNLSQAGIGLGRPMRWLHEKVRWVWRGPRWPRTPGLLPEGTPTPAATLNVQPGEWVRVKTHEEILKTVTVGNLNRGMYWDAELVPYCGGIYRVLKRVTKIIDERTGKMLEMKTPCIVLDSVVCQARYSACRMLCPRAMYPYWREIWLERVRETHESASATATRELRRGQEPQSKCVSSTLT
jgi:hypothetical protein